jgi:hypothetical protein
MPLSGFQQGIVFRVLVYNSAFASYVSLTMLNGSLIVNDELKRMKMRLLFKEPPEHLLVPEEQSAKSAVRADLLNTKQACRTATAFSTTVLPAYYLV